MHPKTNAKGPFFQERALGIWSVLIAAVQKSVAFSGKL